MKPTTPAEAEAAGRAAYEAAAAGDPLRQLRRLLDHIADTLRAARGELATLEALRRQERP